MQLIFKVSKSDDGGLRATCELSSKTRMIVLEKDWGGLELEAMNTIRAALTEQERKAITLIRMEWASEGDWTLEQYEENVGHYKKISNDALMNAKLINSKYLSMAPFRPGDKVRITLKSNSSHNQGEVVTVEAFVDKVKLGSNKKDYDYSFLQVKKDGTVSQKTLYGVYGWSKVEKI